MAIKTHRLIYLFLIFSEINASDIYDENIGNLTEKFAMSCVERCRKGFGCENELKQINICNCDSLCHWFSDCCDEALPPSNISEDDEIIFNSTECDQNEETFLVVKCPKNWTDDNIRTLCEYPSNSSYTELLPVYVSKGQTYTFDVHFRNRYCAICHGHLTYSQWRAVFDISGCDIFKLQDHSHSAMNMNDAYEMMRKEGCNMHFIDVSFTARSCSDMISYPNPSLAIILNFLDEPPQRDEVCRKDQENVENVNMTKEPPICDSYEISRNNSCENLFETTSHVVALKLIYQLAEIIHLSEAEYLARDYLSFINYKFFEYGFYYAIQKWAVTTLPGRQRESGSQCTEIQLDILIGLFFVPEIETKLATELVSSPCLHLPCPVTFLPFSHPMRSNFCDTSIITHCSSEIFLNQGNDVILTDVFGGTMSLQSLLTFISLSLSAVSLSLTLILFIKCPLFKNLPGKNHTSLTSMMLLANGAFLVGASLKESSLECKIVSVASHYFWLGSFCWMSICSFHAWFTFSPRGVYRHSNDQDKHFKRYCIFGFIFPLLIVITVVVVENFCEKCGIQYGERVCFMSDPFGLTLGFALPIGLMLLLNYTFFTLTIINIQRIDKLKDNYFTSNRSNFLIYIKLSSLMGLTWFLGFIAEIVKVNWLSYISISCNGLQGVFIFISFICNERVLKWMKDKRSNTQFFPNTKVSETNVPAQGSPSKQQL